MVYRCEIIGVLHLDLNLTLKFDLKCIPAKMSHLQFDWSKSVKLCCDWLRDVKFLVFYILGMDVLTEFCFKYVVCTIFFSRFA